MSFSEKQEIADKYVKLRDICKEFWNIRCSPLDFKNSITKEFEKDDIILLLNYFMDTLATRPTEFNKILSEYFLQIISDDPTLIFSDLDFNNPIRIAGARKIIQMLPSETYNILPIYNENSAKCALNILIVLLLNENKSEVKKDIFKISQSSYFSILIASGKFFDKEKHKKAQVLFKENNPFECSIHQLPLSRIHLILALFPKYVHEQFNYDEKYQNLFFLFAITQFSMVKDSKMKIFLNDSIQAKVFCCMVNYYMAKPSYLLSFVLNTFPEEIVKFNSNKLNVTCDDEKDDILVDNNSYYQNSSYGSNSNLFIDYSGFNENGWIPPVLHYFYDNENSSFENYFFDFGIINEQLPNGILPTYDKAFNFLSVKPNIDSIPIESFIEEALNYPALTSDVGNFFNQKLKEKDIVCSVKLAKQILKRLDDIQICWSLQLVFFPIMKSLYELFVEIDDDKHFEILFFLFISFFEGCTNRGDEEINNACYKFISSFDEPFRLYLTNFLNTKNEIFVSEKIDLNSNKPLNKLINFLKICKDTNDFDINEVMKYPYLFMSAYIWGFKTLHPNTKKLLSLKFPSYKILKRFFILLSACHHNNQGEIENETSCLNMFPSNMFLTVDSSELSYELALKFLPKNQEEIKFILFQQLQDLSFSDLRIKSIKGIIISWRVWIKELSTEMFVLILLKTIIWAGEKDASQIKTRSIFLYAGKTLTYIVSNPIKTSFFLEYYNEMNENESEYDKFLSNALWTTLNFVNCYQGAYDDGLGLASFCLLLIVSLKSWKSEFEKVLKYNIKMVNESSWKSLKYSFVTDFLFISLSILEIQDLIHIEMFDKDFLQLNWQLAINFFVTQAERKKIKEKETKSQENK